ncbi:hypothetical protein JW964_02135 [candidate division KSB1 bacterium]|nr:hypothetical protein [candidate division KSB1 bacterium]
MPFKRIKPYFLFIIVLLFLMLALGYTLFILSRSQDQFKIVRANQLATQSEWLRSQRGEFLGTSALLAIESLKRFPSGEGGRALLNAMELLPRHPVVIKTIRAVKQIDFSPDSRWLATVCDDGTASVWSAEVGRELFWLTYDRAFSAMTSGTADAGNVEGGSESIRPTYNQVFNAVIFSPDSQRLALAGSDKSVRIWKLPELQELLCLQNENEVKSLCFSPDGKRLVTTFSTDIVTIWNVHSGQKIVQLHHDNLINSVVFSSDGQRLATSSWDKTARIWNSSNGQEFARLRHDQAVQALAFSPDGQRLATTSGNGLVHVWNTANGQELIRLHHYGSVNAVIFSPDRLGLARNMVDQKTCRLGIAVSHQRTSIYGNENQKTNSKSYRLATACGDNFARLWELDGDDLNWENLSHDDAVLSVAFSPDGAYLVTAGKDKTARIWNEFGEEKVRLCHDGEVKKVIFSPDGHRIATVGEDNTVRICDVYVNHEEDIVRSFDFKLLFRLHQSTKDKIEEILRLFPHELIKVACPLLDRNFTAAEWQRYFPDEPYCRTCANLPVHPSFIELGRQKAREGDLKVAKAIFQRAVELDFSLKVDLEAEARAWRKNDN